MNASDNVIRESGEYINSLAGSKYQLTTLSIGATTSNINFVGCCFASFSLSIHHFNHNGDNGNYWCQIVANSRPLEPSPYAYISLSSAMSIGEQRSCIFSDLIRHLSPAQCAWNVTSTPSSRITCNYQSTTTIAEYPQTNPVTVIETIQESTNAESMPGTNRATTSPLINTDDPVTIRSSNSQTTTITAVTVISQSEQSESVTATTLENTELVSASVTMNTEFTNTDSVTTVTTNVHVTTIMKDNSSLLYGAIAGAFIACTVVLLMIVLCLAILFYKYTRLKKQGKPKKLIQQVSLKNF